MNATALGHITATARRERGGKGREGTPTPRVVTKLLFSCGCAYRSTTDAFAVVLEIGPIY